MPAAAAPAPSPSQAPSHPAIDPELLRRHDVPGPRYTSYPTADRFVEAFTEQDYVHALRQRSARPATATAPLGVYVHIPFCASLCWFCACNRIVTKQRDRGAQYLALLARELGLQVAQLGAGVAAHQLHLGGGSPTFLNDAELAQLTALLRDALQWRADSEWSIEVDPRTVDAARLAHLSRLGFNRVSFGVQDFDPAVQQAVHRVQSQEQVFELVREARRLGFRSVNVDLIHGLPRQTPESFARTLRTLRALRPDRIALYGYAHLPERFKAQRRIHAGELPGAAERAAMLAHAIATLREAGYVDIGMDHFALPGDALAVAKRQGRLHRNFQGYTDQPDGDLLALGVSAIGRIGATYSQNAKTLDDYADLLGQGRLPVVRGLALTRDDVLRRAVIMALMCQGRVDFEALGSAHLVDFREHFAPELSALAPLQQQGLVRVADDEIELTPTGWFFVRAIAMVFDHHLHRDSLRRQFSRVL